MIYRNWDFVTGTPPPQADEDSYVVLSSLDAAGELYPEHRTVSAGTEMPQAMLNTVLKGYVDPSRWDQGINAAMVSYNANHYHATNKRDGSDNDNAYLTLSSGLNLAGWQLRINPQ